MDLLIYWGAVSGTIGTITAMYSVWLNRKFKLPRIVIDNPILQLPENAPNGTSIQFRLGLSNAGLVPISVNQFKIDMGFILPDKFYYLFESKKIEKQLELSHIIPKGVKINGETLEKPQRGQSIFIEPGEHIERISCNISIYWKHSAENKDYDFFENLTNPILKGKYKFICILSNNKRISIKGKKILREITN